MLGKVITIKFYDTLAPIYNYSKYPVELRSLHEVIDNFSFGRHLVIIVIHSCCSG